MYLGKNTAWDEFFSGALDEVRIYDRALSQAEIGTLMQVTPITIPTGLLAAENTAVFSIKPYPVRNTMVASVTDRAMQLEHAEVCDLSGNRIIALRIEQGNLAYWDSRRAGNGVYLLKATINGTTVTRRIAVVK